MKRLASMLLLALLAACGRDGALPVENGVVQTRLPGHVTAGGKTSGAAIAATGGGPSQPGPAGTPGIPGGAEGNVGGTAMGGTGRASATAAGPAASAPTAETTAAPAAAPASAAGGMSQAEMDARALAASMDAVAAHWRTRAAAQGWAMAAPTPVDPLAGFHASATQSAPAGQPQGVLTEAGAAAPMASEKHGTARPSRDVKAPTKPPPDPGVGAKAPDAAN